MDYLEHFEPDPTPTDAPQSKPNEFEQASIGNCKMIRVDGVVYIDSQYCADEMAQLRIKHNSEIEPLTDKLRLADKNNELLRGHRDELLKEIEALKASNAELLDVSNRLVRTIELTLKALDKSLMYLDLKLALEVAESNAKELLNKHKA